MYRDAALDFDSLARRLRRRAGEKGWSLAVERRVDSTNERVRALVDPSGRVSPPPVVAVAAEQTAGVGRRGARWVSEPGDGLWFSLIVPAEARLPAAPPGLALAGQLVRVLRDHGVPACVRWPNDLYLAEGKLGGVMIERARAGGQWRWLAGVGINWRHPAGVRDAVYPTAALGGLAERGGVDSVALALALVEAAVDAMQRPERWPTEIAGLARAHHAFGRPVIVERGAGERESGTAGLIRPDGELEIVRPDGAVIRAGTHDRVRSLDERSPGTDHD